MARSDLLITLVRAGIAGDRKLLERAVEALVAEERGKQHHVLADRLETFLRQNGHGKLFSPSSPTQEGHVGDLFYEVAPQKRFDDLILPPSVARACTELVEEHERKDLLRSHNLEPRNRLLVVGPPGNGKTSLAESIAHALVVPMIVVRYDGAMAMTLSQQRHRMCASSTCRLAIPHGSSTGS